MPLVPCPACNRQVSTSATACPGCGHPLQSNSATQNNVIGKVALAAGAWAIAPWIARLLAFVAICVVAIVALFLSR